MLLRIFCSLIASLTICSLYRALTVLKNGTLRRVQRGPNEHVHLAVFLGSGGHTTESLALVSALDFERYTPRTYVVSEGDSLSQRKAEALEEQKAPAIYNILAIPRARQVHQPIYTTPPTALKSLFACLYHVVLTPALTQRPFADVLLLNGPGTCFVLCITTFIGRFFAVPTPRVIYVESFARVKTLSLSGRLLWPLVDKFVVQWPELLSTNIRGECHGWLI